MQPDHNQEAIDALTRLLAPGPSPEALERFSAVPLAFDPPRGIRAHRGRLELDSWAGAQGVRLRDTVPGHVRRLRLGWRQLHLDIVAERDHDGWQFTARVEEGERVAHDFVLQVDTRKLMPRSGGYYRWSSRGVPRALNLWSTRRHIEFEELAWR